MVQVTHASLVQTATADQQRAITTDGPLLIIAGPGSGKTFTLVERVVHLITTRGVTPEQLMVVTFTEKAAQELTTRISNRLSELGVSFNLNEMYLGTFHSICLRWLQDYRERTRLKHNFTMMDDFDQHYFLYQRIAEYDALPGAHSITGAPEHPTSEEQHGPNRWKRSERLQTWINTVAEESLNPATLAAPDPAIIVEVKGNHQVEAPVVRAKQEFAEQMAKASRMTYCLNPGSRANAGQYDVIWNPGMQDSYLVTSQLVSDY